MIREARLRLEKRKADLRRLRSFSHRRYNKNRRGLSWIVVAILIIVVSIIVSWMAFGLASVFVSREKAKEVSIIFTGYFYLTGFAYLIYTMVDQFVLSRYKFYRYSQARAKKEIEKLKQALKKK